jgi:hypothetical protein
MKIDNTMELTIFIFFKVQLQIKIQPVALKITSYETIEKKKTKETPKSYDVQVKQTYFCANQG